MTREETEARFLQSVVAPELEAEGYEVYLYPKRPRLPEFFGSYPPDAIALGAKKNLAIEVLQKTPNATQKLERVKKLLEGQRDWELRVYWAEPLSSGGELQVQSGEAIRKSLREIRDLIARDNLGAALLLSWATFEAAGRILVPEQFRRPQSPGRLVQILAQLGSVTPSEADSLRRLANIRNALIHGDLGVPVPKQDVAEFVDILETLLLEIG